MPREPLRTRPRSADVLRTFAPRGFQGLEASCGGTFAWQRLREICVCCEKFPKPIEGNDFGVKYLTQNDRDSLKKKTSIGLGTLGCGSF